MEWPILKCDVLPKGTTPRTLSPLIEQIAERKIKAKQSVFVIISNRTESKRESLSSFNVAFCVQIYFRFAYFTRILVLCQDTHRIFCASFTFFSFFPRSLCYTCDALDRLERPQTCRKLLRKNLLHKSNINNRQNGFFTINSALSVCLYSQKESAR